MFTHSADYDLLGDDSLASKERLEINQDSLIWYVFALSREGPIAIFSLFPQNTVCWDLHVSTLPWAETQEKWSAARGLVPWLAQHSKCKRLTAAVPATNRRALFYGTHGLGMRYIGRHEKAFLKQGTLIDLVILGREVKGGMGCPA